LVKSIHQALVDGSKRKGLPDPPSGWTEKQRDAYVELLRKKLKME